jgi:hypothetical protein
MICKNAEQATRLPDSLVEVLQGVIKAEEGKLMRRSYKALVRAAPHWRLYKNIDHKIIWKWVEEPKLDSWTLDLLKIFSKWKIVPKNGLLGRFSKLSNEDEVIAILLKFKAFLKKFDEKDWKNFSPGIRVFYDLNVV